MSELCYLDATELALQIGRREISPVEVVRALRDRAEALNPRLNALVTHYEDAEDRAREAEAVVRRGERLGPLHGVPFTIKDSFDTAGVRTTRGSLLFFDRVPDRDATAVARLRDAGAIPLAKTNLPEFALWWETDNLVFGRTPNPWNLERTAGGSSGGEAAALAAGLTPLGLGSDLGGSIRLPAHYCGVVGLKPTHGLVPLTGHWPEVLLDYMHVGPMARSVRDAAVALAAIAGPDGEDARAVPVLRPAAVVGGGSLAPLRIGWLTNAFGTVDAGVAAVVARAAAALHDAGATVEEAELPGFAARDCNTLTLMLYGAGAAAYFDRVVAGRQQELHSFLARRLSGRTHPTLDGFLAGEAAVEALRRELAAFFRGHDLLLCPTAPTPAHGHGLVELELEGQMLPPRTTMRATIPFDLTGSPALNVPFGRSADGLPVGVQLVGRHFEEGAVLRAGSALEERSEETARRPNLV